MPIGAVNYPASLDTADTLIRSGEEARTRLAQPVNATATTLPLESTAKLTPSGQVRVEREYVTYTGIAGNSLTGCVRGAFQGDGGYPASEHPDGAEVAQAAFVPAMHRVQTDAIIALETAAKLAPPGLVVAALFGTAVTTSNNSTSTFQTFLTGTRVLPAGTYDIDCVFDAEFLNNTANSGATARVSAPGTGANFDGAEANANSQFTVPGGASFAGIVSDGATATTFTLQYRANIGGTASTRTAWLLGLCRRAS